MFNFGGGSTPSPAPGPPPAAPGTAAPSGGFTFGGSAPTPAGVGTGGQSTNSSTTTTTAPVATPAAVPGFSFGGAGASSATGTTSNATTVPTMNTTAGGATNPSQPPSTVGFNPTAPAPSPFPAASTATGPSAAPATAASLATPAPAPNAFAAHTTPGPATTEPATIVVPKFDDVFTRLQVWDEVKRLCDSLEASASSRSTEPEDLIGQELRAFLGDHATTTIKPKPVLPVATPDNVLRSNLQQKPLIGLDGNPNKTRTLTQRNLHEILSLANDLQISEGDAIALYVQVASQLDVFQQLLSKNRGGAACSSLLEEAFPPNVLKQYSTEGRVAREVYFLERHLQLQSLLYLAQMRLTKDPYILWATDFLLSNPQANIITGLIDLVKSYDQRSTELQNLVRSREVPNHQSMWQSGYATSGSASNDFAKVHLLFCQRERQTACEILFFIAYDTQLTVDEVSKLVDLIKNLSDSVPQPSPLTDVPSAYESDGMDEHMYSSFTSSRKEKGPLQWQRELVERVNKTGQIQVMQCNTILVMAAVAAMDTQNTLHNRETRGPNQFGAGNNLVPPHQTDLYHLLPLHERLNATKAKDWIRKDVWGVLAFSYSLLLRSAPAAMMSPRMGGSGDPRARELREDAKHCFERPLDAHSFSYCRTTVVPVLERMKSSYVDSRCNISEFSLSVLSQTYSLYMAVIMQDPPRFLTSWKRWKSAREEEIKFQTFQQQQQQDISNLAANFGGHTKTSTAAQPPILNLMDRPDCLDDLMALASTLSALGKEFSKQYWEIGGEGGKTLTPVGALRECMQKAIVDKSLLPCVFSWLASLTHEETSANAVNEWFAPKGSADDEISGNSSMPSIGTWTDLISRIQQIVQSFQPHNVTQNPASTTSSTPAPYYSYDLGGHVQEDAAASTAGSSSTRSSSKKVKVKEIKGPAKFEMMSILSLITNVCLYSSKARLEILSLKLPPSTGQPGQMTALVALFNLAIAPLNPHSRGAVFNTIASLFPESTKGMNEKEVAVVKEEGRNAWNYLETAKIVPIYLLDQYRMQNPQNTVGMTEFPPSSKKLASARGSVETVFPNDTSYQVIYELEHVESKVGVYPSTEGLLVLLRSLVCSVGCLPELGQGFRARTGCTPYLEYIMSFVLPRALGSDGTSGLPFRLEGDRCRLVTKALKVVNAVLVRYDLSPLHSGTENFQETLALVGLEDVANKLLARPAMDGSLVVNDFVNSHVTRVPAASNQPGILPATATTTEPTPAGRFPASKSPAFTVMFNIISSSVGVLLKSLAFVLTQQGGASGLPGIYSKQADAFAMVYAIFGVSRPTLRSATMGDSASPDQISATSLQEFIAHFQPTMCISNVDAETYDDAIMWRERSVDIALHTLCAAVVRQHDFILALKKARDPVKIVPILRCNHPPSPALQVIDVNVSTISDLLFTVSNSASVRSAIVSFIGYSSTNDEYDKAISSTALAMTYYMRQNMPTTDLPALWGFNTTSSLSMNVAKRLVSASQRSVESSTNTQMVRLILGWILSELRSGNIQPDGLALHLLGLPDQTTSLNNTKWGTRFDGTPKDCFDAILLILLESSVSHLARNSSGSAPLSFEVIFRLCNLLQHRDTFSQNIITYTVSRLRQVHFWEENANKWLADTAVLQFLVQPFDLPSQSQQVMQSIAWLLKGLSCELRILVGSADTRCGKLGILQSLLPPQPQLCSQLISSLLADGAIMKNLINALPINKLRMDPTSATLPQNLIASATFPLPGPVEVVGGYDLIDTSKLVRELKGNVALSDSSSNEIQRWIESWNTTVQCDCAIAHLSNAIAVVLEVALYTAETMSMFEVGHINTGNAIALINEVLTRLNGGAGRAMDEDFSSSATRNLGDAVLILANFATRRGSQRSPTSNANDFLTLALDFSKSIQSSAAGSDAVVDSVLRNERTVCLASAMALLMHRAVAIDPTILVLKEDFVRAFQSLAVISCTKVDSSLGTPNSMETISIMARSVMADMVDTFPENLGSPTEHSFVGSACPLSFVESLLRLIVDLDTNVAFFLQSIALQPSGAALLISAGMGQAFVAATSTYARKEELTRSNILAPSFLIGHLKLMSSLLATHQLPEHIILSFVANCIDALGVYKPILMSLCDNFPRQVDSLREFLNCLALIASVTNPIVSGEMTLTMTSQKQELRSKFNTQQFAEAVYSLVRKIWEHPLPSDMQRSVQFPEGLSSTDKRYETMTWWDNLEAMMAARQGEDESSSPLSFASPLTQMSNSWTHSMTLERKWSETMFEYSIAAMKVLSVGCSLIRRLNRPDLADIHSLARGICRCTHAAKMVSQRLEDVQRSLGATFPSVGTDDKRQQTMLEIRYLQMLTSTLAESVEHEVLLAAMVLAGGSSTKENARDLHSAESALASALSLSGLQNPSFLSGLQDGKERGELLGVLTKDIIQGYK